MILLFCLFFPSILGRLIFCDTSFPIGECRIFLLPSIKKAKNFSYLRIINLANPALVMYNNEHKMSEIEQLSK